MSTDNRTNFPATTTPDRELVKEIAMDIGKEVVSHIRIMYPAAFAALGSSGQLSVRNCTHNEIMAALETMDADKIRARLENRRKLRRQQHKVYDDIRKRGAPDCPEHDAAQQTAEGEHGH